MFAIERDRNGLSSDERKRIRQERSRPLAEALGSWLREQYARLSPNSQVAKAIAYSLNCWDALVCFLDDGRLCLSNNAAERALRGIAVGRRNWTFAGSDEGGRRAAAIYTLIETAKLNDTDPLAWLWPACTIIRFYESNFALYQPYVLGRMGMLLKRPALYASAWHTLIGCDNDN